MSSINTVLKYVNSIPFEFTIKHYQTFDGSAKILKNNDLLSVESWDTLRLNHPLFSVSETRSEWLEASENIIKKDGQDGGLISRAKDISELFRQEGVSSIFSVGVGGAGLEYQIKKNIPNVKLSCSEYSSKNVEVLKNVFLECDTVVLFDILKGDWGWIKKEFLIDKNSVLVMYRLDAGFTDEEWKKIFNNIHSAHIEHILYIPTTCLTVFSIWNRKLREIQWLFSGRPISFCGYLRSKKTFQSYWKHLYSEKSMKFGGLTGFYLTILK